VVVGHRDLLVAFASKMILYYIYININERSRGFSLTPEPINGALHIRDTRIRYNVIIITSWRDRFGKSHRSVRCDRAWFAWGKLRMEDQTPNPSARMLPTRVRREGWFIGRGRLAEVINQSTKTPPFCLCRSAAYTRTGHKSIYNSDMIMTMICKQAPAPAAAGPSPVTAACTSANKI